MTDLKETYRRYTGRRIDAKSLVYWVEAMQSSAKDAAAFLDFVRNSSDYHNHLVTTFKLAYLEMVGSDPSSADVAAMLEATQGALVDESGVAAYVAGLPAFRARCMERVAAVNNSRDQPSDALHVEHVATTLVTRGRATDADEILTLLDAGDCCAIPAPPERAPQADAATQTEDGACSVEDVPLVPPSWVSAFEEQFRRRMFVPEFLRLLPVLRDHDQAGAWLDAFEPTYRDAYERLSSAHAQFAGAPLDEYAFVTRHLDDVLREGIGFVDAEIDAIIESDAYRIGMRRVLAAEFELLYDRPLGDPAALEYLVQGAKAARMALADARIREYVVAYKKDTDAFVDNVYGAYIDVYQRAPDASEVQHWLPLHREGNVPRAIAKVTESLVRGLEFHDVLKKMIRAECLEADGLEPPASTLYRLLDECVGRVAVLSTRDAVKEDVRNVVARYMASSST